MNHHQANELLPCPFCGSSNVAPDEWSGTDDKNGPGCGDCGALGESTSAWNRRAAPTEPAVDRDALILVRAAAKDMYNKTFAEKRLRLSSYFSEVRDAAVAAGEVFVAAIKATEHLAAPAAPAAPAVPTFKDHNIRQLVNDLRDIATTFHAAGQLRERIAGAVQQFLATPSVPAVPAAPLVASIPTKIELWEQIRTTISCAEDAMIDPPRNSAKRAYAENYQDLDRMIDRLYAPPSPSVDQAKRLVGGEVADWQSITAPGQVKVGDKLRFNIGNEQFNERVKQIINEGRADEELIYNKRKNYYVITKNVLTGFGNVKNCQFLRASTGPATSTDTKESA